VVVLLKPHLTQDNHVELLASVSGSNVRRAKEWIAARFPQPDVPSSIRKHPERRLVTRESPALALKIPHIYGRSAAARAIRWPVAIRDPM
jgi:hypothetical protein